MNGPGEKLERGALLLDEKPWRADRVTGKLKRLVLVRWLRESGDPTPKYGIAYLDEQKVIVEVAYRNEATLARKLFWSWSQ